MMWISKAIYYIYAFSSNISIYVFVTVYLFYSCCYKYGILIKRHAYISYAISINCRPKSVINMQSSFKQASGFLWRLIFQMSGWL